MEVSGLPYESKSAAHAGRKSDIRGALTWRPESPTPHVLPWSWVGLDGLSNLVLASAACNLNKSQLLPDPRIVVRALDRGQETLTAIADSISWPSQFECVVSAARGLYSTQPAGTPLWIGRQSVDVIRADFAWPRR